MAPARVVVSHSASGRALAQRLVERLAARGVDALALGHSRPGRTLAARAKEALRSCELLLVLEDDDAARSAWVQQEIGFALARDLPVILVADARRDRALLADVAARAWPSTPAKLDALATHVQRALPGTPRAAARSLALVSQERWTGAIREEAHAELAARGWQPHPLPAVWDEEGRVFQTRVADVAWRKRVRGRWVYLRPRVAPFNPIDLLQVRRSCAPRVYEWWLLRTGRSDGWMQRLYGGASELVTARTRFFGAREPMASPARATLIHQRFLTQRIERTGELAAELAALEKWAARAALTPAARPTRPRRACPSAPGPGAP